MSHKNKKYAHAMVQHEDASQTSEKPTNLRMFKGNAKKQTRPVSRTLSSNLGLIATIGAGCAAAAFLIATEMGRDLSRSVATKTKALVTAGADRISDLVTENVGRVSDYITERGSEAYEFLKSKIPSSLSGEDLLEQTEFDDKIHQLQEKFKSPSA